MHKLAVTKVAGGNPPDTLESKDERVVGEAVENVLEHNAALDPEEGDDQYLGSPWVHTEAQPLKRAKALDTDVGLNLFPTE